ncbi:hypothetical protein BCR26_08730 [Enterococcus rivorum]|uniref:Uncharacterized protein n=3 Tax=Enterococcus rivorum TaxID=762845 RepID=A0A1E5L0E5_9ENTE|nr:hypothetical protein BCR26_08730 [Enterococcus rivorum]
MKVIPSNVIEIDFEVDLGIDTWIQGLGIIMDTMGEENVEIEIGGRMIPSYFATRYTFEGTVKNYKKAKITGKSKVGTAIYLLSELHQLLLEDFRKDDCRSLKWYPLFDQDDEIDKSGNLVKITSKIVENSLIIKELSGLTVGDLITPIEDERIPELLSSHWHEITKVDVEKGRVYFKRYSEDSSFFARLFYKWSPEESSVSIDRILFRNNEKESRDNVQVNNNLERG